MSGETTKDKAKQPVIVNLPLNWSEMNLSEQAKSLRFCEDENGNLWAMPVVLFDTTPNLLYEGRSTNPAGKIKIVSPFGNNIVGVKRSSLSAGYGMDIDDYCLEVLASLQVYNNLSTAANTFEAVRTPNVFKQVVATTVAATAVWDPAAGKKFRIMGGVIISAGGLLAAGIQKISLLDEAADVGINFQTWVPIAASAAAAPPIHFDLRPNGYLSSTADNILKVTLTSAYTAGAVSITVWGTEE